MNDGLMDGDRGFLVENVPNDENILNGKKRNRQIRRLKYPSHCFFLKPMDVGRLPGP